MDNIEKQRTMQKTQSEQQIEQDFASDRRQNPQELTPSMHFRERPFVNIQKQQQIAVNNYSGLDERMEASEFSPLRSYQTQNTGNHGQEIHYTPSSIERSSAGRRNIIHQQSSQLVQQLNTAPIQQQQSFQRFENQASYKPAGLHSSTDEQSLFPQSAGLPKSPIPSPAFYSSGSIEHPPEYYDRKGPASVETFIQPAPQSQIQRLPPMIPHQNIRQIEQRQIHSQNLMHGQIQIPIDKQPQSLQQHPQHGQQISKIIQSHELGMVRTGGGILQPPINQFEDLHQMPVSSHHQQQQAYDGTPGHIVERRLTHPLVHGTNNSHQRSQQQQHYHRPRLPIATHLVVDNDGEFVGGSPREGIDYYLGSAMIPQGQQQQQGYSGNSGAGLVVPPSPQQNLSRPPSSSTVSLGQQHSHHQTGVESQEPGNIHSTLPNQQQQVIHSQHPTISQGQQQIPYGGAGGNVPIQRTGMTVRAIPEENMGQPPPQFSAAPHHLPPPPQPVHVQQQRQNFQAQPPYGYQQQQNTNGGVDEIMQCSPHAIPHQQQNQFHLHHQQQSKPNLPQQSQQIIGGSTGSTMVASQQRMVPLQNPSQHQHQTMFVHRQSQPQIQHYHIQQQPQQIGLHQQFHNQSGVPIFPVTVQAPPQHSHNQYIGSQRFTENLMNCRLTSSQQIESPKQLYRELKSKFKFLVYENEYYQEELRNLQRKLLKLSRDKNFLLDRLLPYEQLSESSDDSDASKKTLDDRGVAVAKPKKKPAISRQRDPLSTTGVEKPESSGTPTSTAGGTGGAIRKRGSAASSGTNDASNNGTSSRGNARSRGRGSSTRVRGTSSNQSSIAEQQQPKSVAMIVPTIVSSPQQIEGREEVMNSMGENSHKQTPLSVEGVFMEDQPHTSNGNLNECGKSEMTQLPKSAPNSRKGSVVEEAVNSGTVRLPITTSQNPSITAVRTIPILPSITTTSAATTNVVYTDANIHDLNVVKKENDQQFKAETLSLPSSQNYQRQIAEYSSELTGDFDSSLQQQTEFNATKMVAPRAPVDFSSQSRRSSLNVPIVSGAPRKQSVPTSVSEQQHRQWPSLHQAQQQNQQQKQLHGMSSAVPPTTYPSVDDVGDDDMGEPLMKKPRKQSLQPPPQFSYILQRGDSSIGSSSTQLPPPQPASTSAPSTIMTPASSAVQPARSSRGLELEMEVDEEDDEEPENAVGNELTTEDDGEENKNE